MKHFKKFIPLIPIASVGLITAPIISSCSNGKTFSWSYKGKPFEYTKKILSGSMTEKQASDAYFKAIKNDNELLFQDSVNYYYETFTDSNLKKFNYKMQVKKIDEEQHRISMNINVEIEDNPQGSDKPRHSNVEIKLNSFEYGVVYSTEKNTWAFAIITAYITQKGGGIEDAMNHLMNDNKWIASLKIESKFYSEIRDISISANSKSSPNDIYLLIYGSNQFGNNLSLNGQLNLAPKYLSQVEYVE